MGWRLRIPRLCWGEHEGQGRGAKIHPAQHPSRLHPCQQLPCAQGQRSKGRMRVPERTKGAEPALGGGTQKTMLMRPAGRMGRTEGMPSLCPWATPPPTPRPAGRSDPDRHRHILLVTFGPCGSPCEAPEAPWPPGPCLGCALPEAFAATVTTSSSRLWVSTCCPPATLPAYHAAPTLRRCPQPVAAGHQGHSDEAQSARVQPTPPSPVTGPLCGAVVTSPSGRCLTAREAG